MVRATMVSDLPRIPVEIGSLDELRQRYSTNLSRGIIATPGREDLDVGSLCEVILIHPVTGLMHPLTARVVGAARGQTICRVEGWSTEIDAQLREFIGPMEAAPTQPLATSAPQATLPETDFEREKLTGHGFQVGPLQPDLVFDPVSSAGSGSESLTPSQSQLHSLGAIELKKAIRTADGILSPSQIPLDRLSKVPVADASPILATRAEPEPDLVFDPIPTADAEPEPDLVFDPIPPPIPTADADPRMKPDLVFDPIPTDTSKAKKRASTGSEQPASLQLRLRQLAIHEVHRVARSGHLAERIALERIYGKMIWETLLQNPNLTPPEVARIARMGTLAKPLIDSITARVGWLSSSLVRRALLSNPRLSGRSLTKVLHAVPKAELEVVPQQTAYPPKVREAAKRLIGRR